MDTSHRYGYGLALPALFGLLVLAQGVQTHASSQRQRLILALDGLGYKDVAKVQQRGGFFWFYPASRLISTFPAISDVSWHDILGLLPPVGYQRVYFDSQQGKSVGGVLDPIRPIEFERRMHVSFDEKTHHLKAYIVPKITAYKEIDQGIEQFKKWKGTGSFYVYLLGTDAMQHLGESIEDYLDYLSLRLNQLQIDYQNSQGQKLDIALLSDHGMNHVQEAKFLDVETFLKRFDFGLAKDLSKKNNVVFSTDGVSTGFGVFCNPERITDLAQTLPDLEGVDLVSWIDSSSTPAQPTTWILNSNHELAKIESRTTATGKEYRYQALQGDPLRYTSVNQEIQKSQVQSWDGYADGPTWLSYTVEHEYPAALERIDHGHHEITLNPAPILVSVKRGYQVANGTVSVLNKLRPVLGNHGGLDESSSLGVLMANFFVTKDTLTSRVRNQLNDFEDLVEFRRQSAGQRIVTAQMIQKDPRSKFKTKMSNEKLAQGPWLHLWGPEIQRISHQKGTTPYLYVELLQKKGEGSNTPTHRGQGYWDFAELEISEDGYEILAPLSAVFDPSANPKWESELRIEFDIWETKSKNIKKSQEWGRLEIAWKRSGETLLVW